MAMTCGPPWSNNVKSFMVLNNVAQSPTGRGGQDVAAAEGDDVRATLEQDYEPQVFATSHILPQGAADRMRQQLVAEGDDVRASIEAAADSIRAMAAAGGSPETPAPAQVNLRLQIRNPPPLLVLGRHQGAGSSRRQPRDSYTCTGDK